MSATPLSIWDWRQPRHYQVLDLVSQAFPSARSAEAVVSAAGLNPKFVRWTQALRDVWADALENASAENKLAALYQSAAELARSPAHRAQIAALAEARAPDVHAEAPSPSEVARGQRLYERLRVVASLEQAISALELGVLAAACVARSALAEEATSRAAPSISGISKELILEIARGADPDIDLRKPRFTWSVVRADLLAALLRFGEALMLHHAPKEPGAPDRGPPSQPQPWGAWIGYVTAVHVASGEVCLSLTADAPIAEHQVEQEISRRLDRISAGIARPFRCAGHVCPRPLIRASRCKLSVRAPAGPTALAA